MIVEGDSVPSPRRYWSIPNEVNQDITETEAVQQLRELVFDAVTIRLQSEVPVGMYLSGGLDSSIIVCGLPSQIAFLRVSMMSRASSTNTRRAG